jgi:hypothetical protein
MNTFLNLQEEFGGTHFLGFAIEAIKRTPLHERIYNRGLQEQRWVRWYPNYASNQVKRKSQSTTIKDCIKY